MKYVFTFNEINYGRVEFEADQRPDDSEVIEQIMNGMATYDDTNYSDITFVEVDGKAVKDGDGNRCLLAKQAEKLHYMNCLNCSYGFEGVPGYDELGWHGNCPECGSSFDVDMEDNDEPIY